jgi:hypothetical protein
MWPGQRGPSLTPQQQQALLAHQQALLVQQAQQQAAYANPAALAQHQALLAHQQALQANLMQAPSGQYTTVPGWDQQSLTSAFSTVSLNQPQNSDWYFDSGATSHMTNDVGILSSTVAPCFPAPSMPVVFIHCPYSNPHPPQMGRVWVDNNYSLKKWGG